MTNEEFSNTFDVLLNSYNNQAQFGEQSSRQDIVLNEYEKSVLLTQAQDIIVKSYFDRSLNQQGQGFDDSTRRQVDFSSLITVAELTPYSTPTSQFTEVIGHDGGGIVTFGAIYAVNKLRKTLKVRIELTPGSNPNKRGTVAYSSTDSVHQLTLSVFTGYTSYEAPKALLTAKNLYEEWCLINPLDSKKFSLTFLLEEDLGPDCYMVTDEYSFTANTAEDPLHFDVNGVVFKMPTKTVNNGAVTTNVLFVLNEKLIHSNTTNSISKEYVIVPISYKEYDKEKSKSYAQPLKKQAWRLFQGDASDFSVYTELIPKWNIQPDVNNELTYRIRYVRRPRPIVLENMPSEDLSIDGEQNMTTCELNPILHMDILNKAVELAIATRGKVSAPAEN